MRDAVFGDKVIHGCAERLSKQIHRVIGMYTICLSDGRGCQRLLVFLRNVTRQLIRSR